MKKTFKIKNSIIKTFKTFHFPPIGMRTIKSIIATTLTVIIASPFGETVTFYAAIASAISLQATLTDSYEVGFQRIFATFLGAVFGVIGYSILYTFNSNYYFMLLVYVVGISFTIYFCQVFFLRKGVVSAIIGFSAMTLTMPSSHSNHYDYMINTLIGNLLGMIIGIVVNTLLFPPNKKREIFNKANHTIDKLLIVSKQCIFEESISKSHIMTIKESVKTINDAFRLHLKEESKKIVNKEHIRRDKLNAITTIIDDCIYSLYIIYKLKSNCILSKKNIILSKELFGVIPEEYEEFLLDDLYFNSLDDEDIVFNYHTQKLLKSLKVIVTIKTTDILK